MFSFLSINQKDRFRVVDGVRALSLIIVVLGHLFHFHHPNFTSVEGFAGFSIFSGFFRSDLAVDAFFVISGFLIGSLLFKELLSFGKISFKRFYIRRFFRLMPVYFFVVLIGILFVYIISVSDNPAAEKMNLNLMIANFWTNLLYINNFIPIENQFLGWCWSLAVEEQFYLIAPIFVSALFFLKSKNKILWTFISLLIVSFIVRGAVVWENNLFGPNFWGAVGSDSWNNTFSVLYDNLYTRYGGLLIGVFASYFYVMRFAGVKSHFEKTGLSSFLFFISCFLFLTVFLKLNYLSFYNNSSFGAFDFFPVTEGVRKHLFVIIVSSSRSVFSASLMYIILFLMLRELKRPLFLKRFLSSSFFFYIAQISYSAYLIHPFIMLPLFHYFTKFILLYTQNLFVVFFINSSLAVVLIFVSSYLMYRYIEIPFMKIRNKKFLSRIY